MFLAISAAMLYSWTDYSSGGIGGLTFAVAVAKACADIDVNIYESTESFSTVGAGIAVWPRVWDTLRMLGLEDALKSKYTGLGGEKSDGHMHVENGDF